METPNFMYVFFWKKIKLRNGIDLYENFSHFSKSYFPDVRGGVHGFGVPPQNVRTDRQDGAGGGGGGQNRFFGGHMWGRGQRLGHD